MYLSAQPLSQLDGGPGKSLLGDDQPGALAVPAACPVIVNKFLFDVTVSVGTAGLHGTLDKAIGYFKRADSAGREKMGECHESSTTVCVFRRINQRFLKQAALRA